MSTFISPRYLTLGFRAPGGNKYRFAYGIFDTEQILDEAERKSVEATLTKMANDSRNEVGVSTEEQYEKGSKFTQCDSCDKRFETTAALNGHRRIHKYGGMESVANIRAETMPDRIGSLDGS